MCKYMKKFIVLHKYNINDKGEETLNHGTEVFIDADVITTIISTVKTISNKKVGLTGNTEERKELITAVYDNNSSYITVIESAQEVMDLLQKEKVISICNSNIKIKMYIDGFKLAGFSVTTKEAEIIEDITGLNAKALKNLLSDFVKNGRVTFEIKKNRFSKKALLNLKEVLSNMLGIPQEILTIEQI